MLAVRQLGELGVPRGVLRHRLASGRWVRHTEHVLATTSGTLTVEQRSWLGVLHAGRGALVGGVSAAQHAGVRRWTREEVTVLVADDWSFTPVPGIDWVRTRRSLRELRGTGPTPCRCARWSPRCSSSRPTNRTSGPGWDWSPRSSSNG